MGYHVSRLHGNSENDVSVDRMREILDELEHADGEHTDVSLTHESEWSLGVFPSDLLVWENLEHGEPRHMRGVSRERVLRLWEALARGDLDEVEREPWQPGYGQGEAG